MSKKVRWLLATAFVTVACAGGFVLYLKWQLSHMQVGFFTPADVKTMVSAAEEARTAVLIEHPRLQLPESIVADIVSALKALGAPCDQHATPDYVRDSVPKDGLRPNTLGPNGPEALIVRIDPALDNGCSCGASGNCLTRIYTKHGNSYRRVFSGSVQEIVFLPAVHDGRFDFRTFSHFAADQAWVEDYRWNGREYANSNVSCAIGYSDFATRRLVRGQCPGH